MSNVTTTHVSICVTCLLALALHLILGHETAESNTQINPDIDEVDQLFIEMRNRHDSRIRPVRDKRTPVNVTIRLSLFQILNMNEKEQSVLMYIYGHQQWRNEYIYWDPEDANGVSEISFRAKDLWRPDTYLYNGLESAFGETNLVAKVNSSNPGYSIISHLYPVIYKMTCNMHIRYFPYDIQHCRLHFGSWSFDTRSIDYVHEYPTMRMNFYLENSEWSVVNVDTTREYITYACCPAPFAQVYFNLVIQRKPLYYVMNVIFPTVIIAIITLFGFFCPSQASGDRAEKISLGMTSLFAMSVYLLIVAAEIPTTSDLVPVISIFYIGIMLFTTAGTLLTAIMVALQQQGRFGKPVPDKLRRFVVIGIGKKLNLFSTPDFIVQRMESSLTNQPMEVMPLPGLENALSKMENIPLNCNHRSTDKNLIHSELDLETDLFQIESKLKLIIEFLKSRRTLLENQLSETDESQILELEWEWCVNVLEQFFLWIFFIILVVFVVIILIVFQFSDEVDPFDH